jgi:DNA (cytosine-5)-methyltransferase 1
MNYNKILEEIHTKAIEKKEYTNKLNNQTLQNIQTIAQKSFNQKGVFTVLVTLSIYKTVHPKQDIRNHQTQIKDGFSGRTVDTKYITPTLKKLALPSMAESGWLTRSLEQPYPYGLDYEGKISNKSVKKAFIELVHSIEVEKINPKYILVELFIQIIELQKKNQITIDPLENP